MRSSVPGDRPRAVWVARCVAALALAGSVLAIAPEASAGWCGPASWVSPDQGESFARNGALVIEATSEQRDVLKASLGRMRLEGRGGVSIPLVVRRKLEGEVLELLVVPASPLPARTALTLTLGEPKTDEQLLKYVMTTNDASNEEAPRWTGPPQLVERVRRDDKGEHVDVWSIRVPVENASHVLAAIVSQDGLASGDIEAIREGRIRLGTKTCDGVGNRLAGKGPWRATLTAIGPGGREAVAPGKPVVILATSKPP